MEEVTVALAGAMVAPDDAYEVECFASPAADPAAFADEVLPVLTSGASSGGL